MGSSDPLGLTLKKSDASLRKKYNIPNSISGLVITDIQKGSLGFRYRLLPGQVITKVNNRAITSIEEYRKLLDASPVFLLTLYEEGYEFNVVIRQ